MDKQIYTFMIMQLSVKVLKSFTGKTSSLV